MPPGTAWQGGEQTSRMPSDRGQQSGSVQGDRWGARGTWATEHATEMTLSGDQPSREVTMTKRMFSFPPKNSACIDGKDEKKEH